MEFTGISHSETEILDHCGFLNPFNNYLKICTIVNTVLDEVILMNDCKFFASSVQYSDQDVVFSFVFKCSNKFNIEFITAVHLHFSFYFYSRS